MKTTSVPKHPVAAGLRVAIGRIALAAICLVLAACGSRTDTPPTLGAVSQSVAPTITQQPASVSVTAGQAAVFSAAASGTAPLAYQWRRNGVDIAGANATTYTTGAAALADSGAVFQLVFTNGAGSATSNAAALSVMANAAIGTQQFGTPAEEIAYAIATDAQGNFYAAGLTTGSLDGTTTPNGAGTLFLVKYDQAGSGSGSGSSARRRRMTAQGPSASPLIHRALSTWQVARAATSTATPTRASSVASTCS